MGVRSGGQKCWSSSMTGRWRGAPSRVARTVLPEAPGPRMTTRSTARSAFRFGFAADEVGGHFAGVEAVVADAVDDLGDGHLDAVVEGEFADGAAGLDAFGDLAVGGGLG